MYKIGIFGSAINKDSKVIKKARKLGKILSQKKVILITGACTGIPYEVAFEASKNKTKIIGYSAGTDLKSQEMLTPGCNSSIYNKLVYIPKDYEFLNNYDVCRKFRNVTSIANCDAGIIISGRWGTLNEFTNLYDMGKVTGVLTGTGGVADELPYLVKKIVKKSKAVVLFDKNPEFLVDKILREL